MHNNTDQAEEAAAKGGAPAATAAAPVAPSYFPQPSFVSIGAVKSDGLKRKIAEFNGSVDAELQLDDESITALGAVIGPRATPIGSRALHSRFAPVARARARAVLVLAARGGGSTVPRARRRAASSR